MEIEFAAEVVEWRGPAPYHFVVLSTDDADRIDDVKEMLTYGWGMIPVTVTVGTTTWTTSLWPRDGSYMVPLKDAVRRAEHIALGDTIRVRLTLDV